MGTDMQMETQKGPTLQESGNHKSYFEHMYFFFTNGTVHYVLLCVLLLLMS